MGESCAGGREGTAGVPQGTPSVPPNGSTRVYHRVVKAHACVCGGVVAFSSSGKHGGNCVKSITSEAQRASGVGLFSSASTAVCVLGMRSHCAGKMWI